MLLPTLSLPLIVVDSTNAGLEAERIVKEAVGLPRKLAAIGISPVLICLSSVGLGVGLGVLIFWGCLVGIGVGLSVLVSCGVGLGVLVGF
jgi:hypothetical protein